MKIAPALIICVLPFLFISCMYKSVKRGKTDSVYRTYVIEKDNVSYILNLESVFQAHSKSYDGGTLYIRGHNSHRISLYNADDGSLAVRRKVKGKYYPLVGFTRNIIWLYDEKKGLSGLDAFSLEPAYTIDDIFAVNPDLSAPLAACDNSEIRDYYEMDPASGMILVTDIRGNRYKLDTDSLILTPTDEEMKKDPWAGLSSESSGPRPRDMKLEGDLKKKLLIENTDILTGESFIEGRFLLLEGKRYTDSDGIIFIAHKETIAAEEELLISCIEKKNTDEYQTVWTLSIPELYFDVDHANPGMFRRVFSKGDPEYRYTFYTKKENRLYFIYMLRSGCINTDTGELMWLSRL